MSGLCKECGNPGRYSDACKTCADRPSSQTKSIFVQSAEDWANQLALAIAGQGSVWIHEIRPFIESRDAAQRQAGREEAYRQGYGEAERRYQKIIDSQHTLVKESAEAECQRYAALVEAARKLEKVMTEACKYFLSANGSRPDIEWIKAVLEARKAMRDLDEAKGGK